MLQIFTCLALIPILGTKCYQYPHMRKLRFAGLAKGQSFQLMALKLDLRYLPQSPCS